MPPIMIRKKYGYTISVTNGSKRIIGCSKANWGMLKTGSFMSIAGSSVFYRLLERKQFVYTKTVEFIEDGVLRIEGHTGSNLMVDDLISFTNEENKGDEVTIPEERTVANIEYAEDYTIVRLSHPLPPRISHGTITVKKWEAILDIEYVGVTTNEASYEVIKDFTPNLDLPLIKGEIVSNSLLYNESMTILDRKIKDLEDKVSELTKEKEE